MVAIIFSPSVLYSFDPGMHLNLLPPLPFTPKDDLGKLSFSLENIIMVQEKNYISFES